MCCPLVFEFSVGIGGFLIGLGQISFFFSLSVRKHYAMIFVFLLLIFCRVEAFCQRTGLDIYFFSCRLTPVMHVNFLLSTLVCGTSAYSRQTKSTSWKVF